MSSAETAAAPKLPYSRREQRGWYFYDFANSPFSSTVGTLLFGVYILGIAKAAAGPDGRIHLLGLPIEPRSWYSYVVSASVILQVIVLPLAGAIADASARKKQMLAAWAYVGAACTIAMFFITGSAYLFGGLLFLVANVTFGASIVVYNSFLPEIAPPEERDSVSSKGWGLGYLGGGLALAGNLWLFANARSLGISDALAARINLASAGVWWAVFTIIPLLTLRNRAPGIRVAKPGLTGGFLQFWRTLREMRAYPQTLTFLIAYLLYNDAVQAVIYLSGQFGADELKIPMSQLSLAILMVQFVAFVGALVFNWVSNAIGTKAAILVSLVIWTGSLISVFFTVRTTAQFFVMAAIIAIVLGGTQALSRSMFSQMIPKGKEAEYFGLYEISDKGTSWMAPLMFALTLQMTGNYRIAIASLIIFFIAGLLVLLPVNLARAAAEAGNAVPEAAQ